jgi:hypothetical protein
MLKRFLKRRIEHFERKWDYDATYLKEVAEASPAALVKITLAQPLFHHRAGAPAAAWFAAAAGATRLADCAPCFELALKMGQRSGLPAELIEAIRADDEAAMSEDAALGYAFARALVGRDLAALARLRARIVKSWGKRALVSMSTAVATASFYPTVKYGMGHGRPIGGLAAAVARRRDAA